MLYCTVTAENAAKHMSASEIRKWPQRPIFCASSSCCMYLRVKSRGILKVLEDINDGFRKKL